MTSESEREAIRAWVENWARVGPKLDAIRRQELREYRYEDHREEIDGLLELAVRFASPRTSSGLLEQQRLFKKLREK